MATLYRSVCLRTCQQKDPLLQAVADIAVTNGCVGAKTDHCEGQCDTYTAGEWETCVDRCEVDAQAEADAYVFAVANLEVTTNKGCWLEGPIFGDVTWDDHTEVRFVQCTLLLQDVL